MPFILLMLTRLKIISPQTGGEGDHKGVEIELQTSTGGRWLDKAPASTIGKSALKVAGLVPGLTPNTIDFRPPIAKDWSTDWGAVQGSKHINCFSVRVINWRVGQLEQPSRAARLAHSREFFLQNSPASPA